MSTQNLTQKLLARNGQASTQARQFILAFIPDQSQSNITRAWSEQATRTIDVLISFRSAVHCWQAAGKVDDQEFIAEVERLEDVGLSGWFDDLIALAMAGGER